MSRAAVHSHLRSCDVRSCGACEVFSNEVVLQRVQPQLQEQVQCTSGSGAGGGEDGGEDGGEVPARHLKRRKTSAAGFFGEDDDEAGAEEEVPEEDELKAYLPGDAPDQVQVREGCHQLVARAPGQVPKLGRHGSAVLRLPCHLSLGRAPLLPSRHCILSEASVC